MGRIAIAAIACAGCAQVLGIDNTSEAGPPTLHVSRVSIGASVSIAPLDLTANPPTFLVADATQPCGMRPVQGVLLADGSWSAGDVAGDPSAVYTAPDLPTPFMHDLAFQSRAQKAAFWAYEHPNPQPAPASQIVLSMVTLPTPYAAGETFAVDAIGAWTRYQLTAANLPALGGTVINTSIPYASFSPSTPSQPARISAQDVVLVERYAGNALTGVLQVAAFDQSDTSDTLTGPITPVAMDRMVQATVSPMTIAARFSALRPAVSNLSATWGIYASPQGTTGTFPGPALNGGTLAMTDTAIAASYAMPFDGLQWQAVLEYITSERRTYSISGATASLGALAYEIADPATAGTLDLPAALPELISLSGTALDIDGTTVRLDLSRAADVDIVPDAATNTLYQLELDELDVSGTTVTRKKIAAVSGPTPHFELPPWFFNVGTTYTITAIAIVGGYPNAATGDLVTFALPISVSQADSAVFTVAAQ